MFKTMFDWKHLLTPLAIVQHRRWLNNTQYIDSRTLYVFGIRLAYWTTS